MTLSAKSFKRKSRQTSNPLGNKREQEAEIQEKTRAKGMGNELFVVDQMIDKIRADRSQRRNIYIKMMNKEIKKVIFANKIVKSSIFIRFYLENAHKTQKRG